MRPATKVWLEIANRDLRSATLLIQDPVLTPMVAFHAQQVVEKSMRALLEEKEEKSRVHTTWCGCLHFAISIGVLNLIRICCGCLGRCISKRVIRLRSAFFPVGDQRNPRLGDLSILQGKHWIPCVKCSVNEDWNFRWFFRKRRSARGVMGYR